MKEKMNSCTDQAERFLALRDHNENELRTKLREKKFSEAEINETVASLKENNELSEARFVESFIRSNNRRHPEGKALVLQRLSAKGTDRSISMEIVNNIYTLEYTLEQIKNAEKKIEKKYGKIDQVLLRAKLSKLGFSSSEINRSFSEQD